MTEQATMEAVRKSVTVEAPIERAFEVFTAGFGDWWPVETHSLGAVRVGLEPREGGGWYEVDADGKRSDWGEVRTYEPPHRVVLTWRIDGNFEYDPDHESEVEVRFTSEGENSTRVDLEHRNFEAHGDTAEKLREGVGGDGGWGSLLETYADHARA
jgi:uncharacterized protein YndB with AHSA1/START domain